MPCPICKREPEAICTTWTTIKFIDGKNYDWLCWTCSCVPKTYIVENGEFISTGYSCDNLHTSDEMQEQGWDKQDAQFAINAVRKAIKNASIITPFVLDKLYANIQIDT